VSRLGFAENEDEDVKQEEAEETKDISTTENKEKHTLLPSVKQTFQARLL
jgi:hypothetical protein